MLEYMLDTNICIYVIKNYPPELRERFNRLAEQLCISSITLGKLHYGAEKSARRAANLRGEGLVVVTSNVRELERMESVRVENWV